MGSNITHLLDSLGWALLHSLWQGGLAFIGVVLMRLLLRNNAPSLRYLAQLLVLLACFVAFLATFGLYLKAGLQIGGEANLQTGLPLGDLAAPIAATFSDGLSVVQSTLIQDTANVTLIIGVLWCFGFAFMALRYVGAFMLTQRLRRQGVSEPGTLWANRFRTLVLNAGLSANIRLHISQYVSGPIALGFFKPVVLVPVGFLTGLPQDQVEAILLHEIAHIRRYDYIMNLIQTAIKTVFFFHPAIHYISRKIDIEREQACDDLAVAQGHNPRALAQGLAALRLQSCQHGLALNILGDSKSKDTPLLDRLTRLAGYSESPRRSEHMIMSVLTAIFIGSVYVATTTPANAHPESANKGYKSSDEAKKNYKFTTSRINGRDVVLKISEDGRRWISLDDTWYDVDKNPAVINRLPKGYPALPKVPHFNNLDLAGGLDEKSFNKVIAKDAKTWDQFQIDMDYFERNLENFEWNNDSQDALIEHYEAKADRLMDKAKARFEQRQDQIESMFERHIEANVRREVQQQRRLEAKHRKMEMKERDVEMQQRREEAMERAQDQIERNQEIAERQRERSAKQLEKQIERAQEQAERQRERAERAEKQAERAYERAMKQAERQREEAHNYAEKTREKHTALRRKIYAQLLKDGLISSTQSKVTLRYENDNWTANGVAVPSYNEGQYCRIFSDMGVNKDRLTKVEITPTSTHVVTQSKNGISRQTHNVTYSEFTHKDDEKDTHKIKHKHEVKSDLPVAPPLKPAAPEALVPAFMKPTLSEKITAKYGMKSHLWPQTHQGIDLKARTGTPVYASKDGYVSLVTTEPAWGNRIILKHENGYQTLYGHLNSFNVNRGQSVKAGDVIGTVGSTGKSTGPHLHFEIRKDGQTVNPETLIF